MIFGTTSFTMYCQQSKILTPYIHTHAYIYIYVCVCVCVYSIYTCVSAMHWRADREKKMKFVNIWRANCRYSFPG